MKRRVKQGNVAKVGKWVERERWDRECGFKLAYNLLNNFRFIDLKR